MSLERLETSLIKQGVHPLVAKYYADWAKWNYKAALFTTIIDTMPRNEIAQHQTLKELARIVAYLVTIQTPGDDTTAEELNDFFLEQLELSLEEFEYPKQNA